ncbi:MAG: DUF1285 domain-containing protein, partial [Glaciecola sp.]
ILRTKKIKVDIKSFENEMKNSKKLARANWKGSGDKSVEEKWFKIREQLQPTEFLGYEFEKVEGIVLKILKNNQFVETAKIGDEVEIGPDHPVQLRHFTSESDNTETLVPYCLIRRNLWARLHQNVMYQWAEIATETATENGNELTMKSNDYQFSLGAF